MHQLARALRKNMTHAERIMWQRLRNRQLDGFKFRRQKPIGPYVVDFACPEKKLIIEVDGGQHASKMSVDAIRGNFLKNKGYRILRFWNHDVLKDIDAVLEQIFMELKKETPSP